MHHIHHMHGMVHVTLRVHPQAATNGHSSVVAYLLEKGANPRARTKQGRCAMDMAKMWGEASERGPLLPEFQVAHTLLKMTCVIKKTYMDPCLDRTGIVKYGGMSSN